MNNKNKILVFAMVFAIIFNCFSIVATASNILVTAVNLNETKKVVKKSTNFTLTASIANSTATNKNVSWSSSNTAVATVTGSGTNNLTGTVSPIGNGEAVITVSATDGSGKKATCQIIVYDGYTVVVQNSAGQRIAVTKALFDVVSKNGTSVYKKHLSRKIKKVEIIKGVGNKGILEISNEVM